MHNSNQRGYVVHASHNATISDNVAWEGKGHLFMLEDGVERGNKLLRNVGITSRPPKVVPCSQHCYPTAVVHSNGIGAL